MSGVEAATQKFARLPPRAGIPFEGFEFARVKSRLPVARQLKDFLDQCVLSNSVNVARARGHWDHGIERSKFGHSYPFWRD